MVFDTQEKETDLKNQDDGIILPVMNINGEEFILLHTLDKVWEFKASTIDNKRSGIKDILGNMDEARGEGSVKCKPQNEDNLSVNFSFIKLPFRKLKNDKYIYLSHITDIWKFRAEKIDMSKTKKNNSRDPNRHGLMKIEAKKNVKCRPVKTFDFDNYKL